EQVDSHFRLPVLDETSLAELATSVASFRSAFDAGLDGVMIAHASAPAITGSSDPLTFSSLIMSTFLKGQLGFRGLVLTDAMSMLRVSRHVPLARGVVSAIGAGADMALLPSGDPRPVLDALRAAAASGALPA